MSALTQVANRTDSPVGTRFIQHSPSRVFHQVGGEHLERMGVIAEIFNRILTPLYGPQDKAIRQIEQSLDRKCFLLYEGETPAGVLVFKTVLSNEFADYGITDSIEIKSLFVDQSAQNSGRGLGSALVDKVKSEVAKLGLGHKGIHVTVSETKQESLMFFKKKGFEIAHAWEGRYIEGVTEYLLSCPTRIQQIEEGKVAELEEKFDKLSHKQLEHVVDSSVPELVHIIHNAHLDDIHALKKLSDGTFISGSKDNCLYKWDRKGQLVRIVDEVEPTQQDDRDWITAVEVLNEDYWLSGERSGKVILWKTDGEYVREIKLKLPRYGEHFSHQYNTRRVNCLAGGLNPIKPSFFVGFPTMFDEFNFIENRTEASTKVHGNDWVYCIHPINQRNLLTVTGCTVDIWNKTDIGWQYRDNLVPEGRRYQAQIGRQKKWLRPFISSLASLSSAENHFGLSLFDGSVRVIDITNKAIVNQWEEHVGRVWTIENIAQHLFASSGEDRSVKLWDVRAQSSVHTIADHVGQVTSILSLDENVLIAGACPENAFRKNTGAQIRFYDIRR